MKAFVIDHDPGDVLALRETEAPRPTPGFGDLLIRVHVCGVCHTELDEIAGRLRPPRIPVVPGHQAVGIVDEVGPGVTAFAPGDRVGVAWIFSACGDCSYCRSGQENLCNEFRATGCDADGGYAEYLVVGQAFAHRIPDVLTDAEAAPLLCAGAIGYRSLRLTGLTEGGVLGLVGFGASAHLVLQLAKSRYPGTRVCVFARDVSEQEFARVLGADWAGGIEDIPPWQPFAIIDTTPVWTPVLQALRVLAPGGRLVINAIRKEDADRDALRQLSYTDQLWREKEIKSVANVTRRDVRECLAAAAESGIRPEVQEHPLANANAALAEIRAGRIRGARVLRIR
jgi:propanol-preferring alcohol dehydrogenase